MSENPRYCDIECVDTTALEQLLESGSVDMCRGTLKNFLREIGFDDVKSLLMRLYVEMDIYVLVRTFAKEIGVPNDVFVDKYGTIDDIENKMLDSEATFEFFADMLEQCIRWRIEFHYDNSYDAIARAMEYIEKNYMREDLSLGNVAGYVNLTPTYFSMLFKKEAGVNFSEFLTNIRIAKAKELLCRTSKLISEIAYEVGFGDYRYFGQVFKKCTGQTPREFQHGTVK